MCLCYLRAELLESNFAPLQLCKGPTWASCKDILRRRKEEDSKYREGRGREEEIGYPLQAQMRQTPVKKVMNTEKKSHRETRQSQHLLESIIFLKVADPREGGAEYNTTQVKQHCFDLHSQSGTADRREGFGMVTCTGLGHQTKTNRHLQFLPCR